MYAWMTVSDAIGLYLDMKSVCEVEAAEKSLMNDEQFWNENVELSCHVMYVLECKDDTTAVAVILPQHKAHERERQLPAN